MSKFLPFREKAPVTRLQLHHGKRIVAKLPTIWVRESIFDLYLRGYEALGIAANLKVPVEQVRLVLRAYQEINLRAVGAAGLSLRQTKEEIAAQVWREMAGYEPPPACHLRRAA